MKKILSVLAFLSAFTILLSCNPSTGTDNPDSFDVSVQGLTVAGVEFGSEIWSAKVFGNTVTWNADSYEGHAGWKLSGIDLSDFEKVRIEIESTEAFVRLAIHDSEVKTYYSYPGSSEPFVMEGNLDGSDATYKKETNGPIDKSKGVIIFLDAWVDGQVKRTSELKTVVKSIQLLKAAVTEANVSFDKTSRDICLTWKDPAYSFEEVIISGTKDGKTFESYHVAKGVQSLKINETEGNILYSFSISTKDKAGNCSSAVNLGFVSPGTGLFANKEINGVEIDKTSEVTVTSETAVIEGSSRYLSPVVKNDFIFKEGRTVKLSPYAIGQYEVTQDLYEAVMKNYSGLSSTPSTNHGTANLVWGEKAGNRPVESVNWYDAVIFCNELSKLTMTEEDCVYTIDISSEEVSIDLTKKGYRLPTEAEWEYAARGGSKASSEVFAYEWAGADDPKNWTESINSNEKLYEYAWYCGNNKTHEVGLKLPNALGVYDMSGNVWEWCYDWYGSVSAGEETDPTGPAGGYKKVFRGGSSWDDAMRCAVAFRNGSDTRAETLRMQRLGFRIARSL